MNSESQIIKEKKANFLNKLMNKINTNQILSKFEQDFLKKEEINKDSKLHKKTNKLSDKISNLVIKHKQSLNLNKLAERLQNKTMDKNKYFYKIYCFNI